MRACANSLAAIGTNCVREQRPCRRHTRLTTQTVVAHTHVFTGCCDPIRGVAGSEWPLATRGTGRAQRPIAGNGDRRRDRRGGPGGAECTVFGVAARAAANGCRPGRAERLTGTRTGRTGTRTGRGRRVAGSGRTCGTQRAGRDRVPASDRRTRLIRRGRADHGRARDVGTRRRPRGTQRARRTRSSRGAGNSGAHTQSDHDHRGHRDPAHGYGPVPPAGPAASFGARDARSGFSWIARLICESASTFFPCESRTRPRLKCGAGLLGSAAIAWR